MWHYSLICILLLVSCNNNSGGPQNPDLPVSDDQTFITQAYIDSLKANRQHNLVDLRRDLAFKCVDLMNNDYVHVKLKVHPDGTFESPEVLDKQGVDMETIRQCIDQYFKDNSIELGPLVDLPSAGKTTNTLPHVYTLLIY